MIDIKTLINQLEDFKDREKYKPKDFGEFLSKTVLICDYYNKCVKDILNYLQNNNSSIRKYVEECSIRLLRYSNNIYDNMEELEKLVNLTKTYSSEDKKIIDDINKRNLSAFYGYYLNLNNLTKSFPSDSLEIKLFLFGVINDKYRDKIIDNIIKNYLLLKSIEEDKSEKIVIDKKMSVQKEKILQEFLNGNTTAEGIAEKLNNKKSTINNVLTKISMDIDDLNIPMLDGLKRNVKILKFAELYFRQK